MKYFLLVINAVQNKAAVVGDPVLKEVKEGPSEEVTLRGLN